MGKRLILVGRREAIEPLGLLYLVGIADKLGWESRVHLVESSDFAPLLEEVARFKPDIVGFSVWTGWHKEAFAAADAILGTRNALVAMGGPHATYFTEECSRHAHWVVKAEGFRNFRKILTGELPHGIHFDAERMAEGFPVPKREIVYRSYPHLAESPIKSIMCAVGCPFACSYCYAPDYNRMYGGFRLNVRPVDEIVDEAVRVRDNWPLKLIYMQDDIFGYDMEWLREFAKKWRERVGVPIHGQIRLELTSKEERLDLFLEAGFTGLTLAIEHGSDWMRRFVLHRQMPDELVYRGIEKIKARGLALRTEQIYSVPLSDIWSDLETLKLNIRLDPEMMWSSILAPYLGTEMGQLASDLGLYRNNNDDLRPSFFERSVLHHVVGGRRALESVVADYVKNGRDNPLLRMRAIMTGPYSADVYFKESGLARIAEPRKAPIARIQYLEPEANNRYKDQAVMLQRLSGWFAKVQDGHQLAARYVNLPSGEWTWGRLGELLREHLDRLGLRKRRENWRLLFAEEFGSPMNGLPEGIRENIEYFCYFRSGAELARKLEERGFFESGDWRILGTATRHHLFDYALYKVAPSNDPIVNH